MGSRIGGVVFIKVNGAQFKVRGGVTVNVGGPAREAISGTDGVHGFTEKPTVPFIECEISDGKELDIPGLGKMTDETVMAETATGKSYALRNAWVVNVPDLNAVEGSMTLRFEGLACEEIR